MTIIAAFAQCIEQWNLSKQWNIEFVGQDLSATFAKEFITLAVVARKPRHVFDNATHWQIDLDRHCCRQSRYFLCGFLWRCDHEYFCSRQILAQAQRNVARARWHVDKQEVWFIPIHVGQKLLECFVQHWSAPHNRLAFRNKISNRDATHTPCLWWQQHVVDHNWISVGAEHARN